jgi:hypothetical protein
MVAAAVLARPPFLHHLPAAGGIQAASGIPAAGLVAAAGIHLPAEGGVHASLVAAADVQQLAEPWASLLGKYSSVMASSLPVPIHGVQHRIATAGLLVVSKFRGLDPEQLAAACKEFDTMLRAAAVFSPSWTSRRAIFRCRFNRRTSQRWWSSWRPIRVC